MFQNPLSQNRSMRRAQRGQSIVVALLVLLLLGLAGALFVTIVARNVLNAAHASRVLTADQYAHAGITFADAQLSNGLDGADWRPTLQFQLDPAYQPSSTTSPREFNRYTQAVTTLALNPVPAADPDLKYLQAGFARYNTGAGRFLLRVTYDPVNIGLGQPKAMPAPVPPGKYLKIESIGREGIIDNIDPTTYGNNRSSDRTQAYQVAYKPIGITDYARFETNPDNRSETANLGVTSRANASDTDGGIVTPGAYDFNTTGNPSPPVIQPYAVLTTYGAPDAYKLQGTILYPNPTAGSMTTISAANGLAGGGSIHANMPVRFFGKNIVYLNNAGVNAPLFQDSVEIAGDLLLNGYNQANPLTSQQAASLEINPADLAKLTTPTVPGTATTSPQNQFVTPSNDTGVTPSNNGFSTLNGLVRDGAMSSDAYGLPRGIQRLEPPLIDALDTASQMPRYKALTMNSAPRHDPNGSGANGAPYAANSGQYGYGQSIYINNSNDVQENSKSIGGGSTLVDQWLNKTAAPFDANKGGWNGDFYQPPGVNITLGRQNIDPATHKPGLNSSYGIRMTLSSGRWPQPDGTVGTTATQTVMYDDLNASNNPATATSGNQDNDIVIYAEGNVRVHGIVSADPKDPDTTVKAADKYPRHITIVTNGTAYIEGNLLKGNPDSSITVLAHDYVCVNTTQFLAGPQSDDNSLGTPPAVSASGQLTFGSDESRLIQEFSFGLPNSGTANGAYGGVPLGLYISGSSEYDSGGTTAEIEIVNPANGLTVSGAAPFSQANGGPNPIAFDFGGLSPGATYLNGQYTANAPLPNRQYFALPVPLPDMSLTPNVNFDSLVESDVRLLYLRRSDTAPQNLNLERIAILPADIRIEAVLYAQTGSFFVIPGPWFNSSSSDTLDTFINSFSPTLPNGIRVPDADTHFPFYGQPIDLKITIDGSVSEAQPADVSAQTAWMLKWGWIPQYHGFTSVSPSPEKAGHLLPPGSNPPKPAVGLQIIYNPQAGYPYNPLTDGTVIPAIGPHYLRSDVYGRPLPFTPKLPVSTALLFAGESTEPPLLQ
jgi:hypothetical protein